MEPLPILENLESLLNPTKNTVIINPTIDLLKKSNDICKIEDCDKAAVYKTEKLCKYHYNKKKCDHKIAVSCIFLF